MSVVIIVHDGIEHVRPILCALRSQTIASELEIILLGPGLEESVESSQFATLRSDRAMAFCSNSEIKRSRYLNRRDKELFEPSF